MDEDTTYLVVKTVIGTLFVLWVVWNLISIGAGS